MREAFSNALVRLALTDPNVLLLTGDHGYALFDEFRKRCPSQYINVGIAEQNMVGMAAGLARVGFRPFVYGLAAFVPIRTIEQIKIDIAHDDLPVVLLGDGAGFVYSHLGTSHQSTEDIACTRVIPGLEILSPADRFEITACMDYAYTAKRVIYLRMGKSDRGDVHTAPLRSLASGELLQLRSGRRDRPSLLATGSMVRMAVDIADGGLDASVWSVPSIKPIDVSAVMNICDSSRGLVAMEEHSIFGGLGSVLSELLCDHQSSRLLRIGVVDRFSEYCGSYEYLMREHGLDRANVEKRINEWFASF